MRSPGSVLKSLLLALALQIPASLCCIALKGDNITCVVCPAHPLHHNCVEKICSEAISSPEGNKTSLEFTDQYYQS